MVCILVGSLAFLTTLFSPVIYGLFTSKYNSKIFLLMTWCDEDLIQDNKFNSVNGNKPAKGITGKHTTMPKAFCYIAFQFRARESNVEKRPSAFPFFFSFATYSTWNLHVKGNGRDQQSHVTSEDLSAPENKPSKKKSI